MNKTTYNLIITILVLIIVIGGGTLLYGSLKDNVVVDVPATTAPAQEDELAASVDPNAKFAEGDSVTVIGHNDDIRKMLSHLRS